MLICVHTRTAYVLKFSENIDTIHGIIRAVIKEVMGTAIIGSGDQIFRFLGSTQTKIKNAKLKLMLCKKILKLLLFIVNLEFKNHIFLKLFKITMIKVHSYNIKSSA